MATDPMVGTILGGRYQVQAVVGRGGMATVYRAYDQNLRRVVAIKVIHAHISDNPEFLRRFEDEATLVASLRHEHIPVIHDFVHDSGLYYIVMEFMDGESLENRLKRLNQSHQRLAVAEAMRIMQHLCEAAQYAHQSGVVHRDIKPANIIIDRSERVYLMDFGIAKITTGQSHTATGLTLGSASYMAPEQIQGLVVDGRADIYAMGVTLFEMLKGSPPFEADSMMTLMMMHLKDPVPDIHELRPEVPQKITGIILKAMAKVREERYQSAGEFLVAIQGLADQAPAVPPTPPRPEAVKPPAVGATVIERVPERNLPPARTAPAVGQAPPARPPASQPPAPQMAAQPAMRRVSAQALPNAPAQRQSANRIYYWILALFLILIVVGGGILLGLLNQEPAQPPDTQIPAEMQDAPVAEAPAIVEPAVNATHSPTELPPTAVVEQADAPDEPTNAPAEAPTPIPAPTEILRSATSGFVNACIDVGIWVPYKLEGIAEAPAGCWNLSHWGMSVQDSRLVISMDPMQEEKQRSIYRSLPAQATIHLQVRVSKLRTLTYQSQGLAIGFGDTEHWQNGGGLFLVLRQFEDSPYLRIYLASGVLSTGDIVSEARLEDEIEVEIRYNQGAVTFLIGGNEVQTDKTLPARLDSEVVFSIGYSLPTGGGIQAEVVGLAFE